MHLAIKGKYATLAELMNHLPEEKKTRKVDLKRFDYFDYGKRSSADSNLKNYEVQSIIAT